MLFILKLFHLPGHQIQSRRTYNDVVDAIVHQCVSKSDPISSQIHLVHQVLIELLQKKRQKDF